MKRLLTLGTLLLCSLFMFAQGSLSGTGSGTEDDPYRIYNQDQLSQLANYLNQEGVVFHLMKDLDLTNWIAENNPRQGWIPVGVPSSPFKGKFYGKNHRITGFKITRSSEDNVGFFGYVDGATIQDLTLEGTSVTGANNVGALFGTIVNSSITNVSFNGTFVTGTEQVGGFAGKILSSTLANCSLTLSASIGVSAASNVGGFVGYSQNSTFTDFSSSAMLNASSIVGGFAGCDNGGTFQTGTIQSDLNVSSSIAGGFIGHGTEYTLSDIKVIGNITNTGETGYVGGIIAKSNGIVSLSNCSYTGNVEGKSIVSGIVGSIEGGSSATFTLCHSKGKIKNTGDYTGGVVAYCNGACISNMESCSHFGDITGKNYIGGLIGAMLSDDVKPTVHTYTVYSSKSSDNTPTGTLLQTTKETIVNGTTTTCSINNCTAIGNIDGSDLVGGLIGLDFSSYGYSPIEKTETCSSSSYAKYLFIDGVYTGTYRSKSYNLEYPYYYYARNSVSHSLSNSYYSGTINASEYVGGLVGQKGGGEIKNCYSFANIYGATNVGGIVGNTTSQTTLSSYSVTTLKSNVANCQTVSASNSNLGRIYGSIDEDHTTIGVLGSTEGNRALAQAKVVLQGVIQEVEDDLQNGSGIGPTWLRLKANYVSMGWNFDNDWNNLEGECYPYKKYQAAPPVIKSNLVSQATSISGLSINGGTVYLFYKDRDAVSTVCDGHNWTFETEPLQSGAIVQIYADVGGMTPSYFTTTNVSYPGSGTEDDPYRIYTAEDLQGASNHGYYKLMNDIDLTTWINENSPTEGWPAIGRNSGEATYIDGDGYKVTGLWMNTTQNYNGLFSNFSAGQIKNLTVEVAKGKKVKGGDYTGILIGRNANGRLINCTVKGTVEGIGHVGGLVGYVENSNISAISANATITGTTFVGGIAGQAMDCAITTCNAATTITSSGANSKVGGLVGYAKGGTISKCSAQNNLTAADEANYVGGLVGYSETPVSLSFSTGDVTTTGNNSYSGGLIGYALSPIENCYSAANTNGTLYTAGLVGYTFSSIDKCYAKGDVHGVYNGAGVVGYLDGTGASLSNSIACCNILSLTDQSAWGSRVIGGFKNGAAEPGNNNYALSTMQVSLNNYPEPKTDDPVEGIAKTEAELKTTSTYVGLGWDMENVWTIVEGDSYPTLKNNEESGGNQEDPDDFEEGANTLFGSDLQASAGKIAVLPIILTNENEVKLCQFDLQLPTGVTVATMSNGKLDATLTERAESHSITGKQLTNGDYRFVISSLDNESFTGNSGTLLEITIDVPATMEGEYSMKILNVELSVPYGNELKVVKPADTQSKLIVSSFILGDVNNDGSVSVTDVGCVINYILEQVPSVFVFDAADMNGDKSISVTDVGMIINLILNEGATASPKLNRTAVGNAHLTQQPTTDGYRLQLGNKDAFIGFQMDLQVTNGANINGMELIGGEDHLMTYRQLANGTWRVICYSPTNSTFEGNEAGLLNISTIGDVTISNVRLTTADLSEISIDAISTETTGIIDRLVNQNEELKVYTLDGRLCRTIRVQQGENPLNGLKPGVYMIGNRKVVVR